MLPSRRCAHKNPEEEEDADENGNLPGFVVDDVDGDEEEPGKGPKRQAADGILDATLDRYCSSQDSSYEDDAEVSDSDDGHSDHSTKNELRTEGSKSDKKKSKKVPRPTVEEQEEAIIMRQRAVATERNEKILGYSGLSSPRDSLAKKSGKTSTKTRVKTTSAAAEAVPRGGTNDHKDPPPGAHTKQVTSNSNVEPKEKTAQTPPDQPPINHVNGASVAKGATSKTKGKRELLVYLDL